MLVILTAMVAREFSQRLKHIIQASPSGAKIRRMSLFGSHLHGTATKKSDIDFLIEITGSMGLFELSALQQFLEEKLGSRVDLVEPDALNRHIRDQVLQEATLVYDA